MPWNRSVSLSLHWVLPNFILRHMTVWSQAATLTKLIRWVIMSALSVNCQGITAEPFWSRFNYRSILRRKGYLIYNKKYIAAVTDRFQLIVVISLIFKKVMNIRKLGVMSWNVHRSVLFTNELGRARELQRKDLRFRKDWLMKLRGKNHVIKKFVTIRHEQWHELLRYIWGPERDSLKWSKDY